MKPFAISAGLATILATCLISTVAWTWSTFTGAAVPTVSGTLRTQTPPPAGVSMAPSMTVKPLSAYPQTATRPLFFEDRTYPKRAVEKAPAAVVPPPVVVKHSYKVDGMRLAGLVAGIAAGRMPPRALIEAGDKSAWLSLGGNINGWTVRSIGENSVQIARDGQAATLLLYRFPVEN